MTKNAQSIETYQEIDNGSPERNLLAAILLCAVNDVATGAMGFALPAYDWIMDQDPDFIRYCQLLDIDPKNFADRLFWLHGERAERFRRYREERRRQRQKVRP